jgi:thioredoxin-like negative regulator of GroEL
MSGVSIKLFSAEWCPNCKPFKKSLDDAGVKYDLYDVDDESVHNVVNHYNVRGLPTTIIELDGEVIRQIVGLQPVSEVTKYVKKEISNEVE